MSIGAPRGGGPNPCKGAAELNILEGGARTVILISRDDFNICTHLCIFKKNMAIEEKL